MLPDAIPVIIHLREADWPSESSKAPPSAPEATPESWTTQLVTSIPVLQGHLDYFLAGFWGGIGGGMKPWCSSKGKEGQQKCSSQFQLPQLSTSTWRNWVWAQAFSWKDQNWRLWLFWKLLKAIPGLSHWDTLSEFLTLGLLLEII